MISHLSIYMSWRITITTEVVVSKQPANYIESNTHCQCESNQRMKERSIHTTASVVGGIMKMRKTTKRSKKVESLLYHKFRGNEARRYDNRMKRFAREKYLNYHQKNGNYSLKLHETDLIYSVENRWLAATQIIVFTIQWKHLQVTCGVQKSICH